MTWLLLKPQNILNLRPIKRASAKKSLLLEHQVKTCNHMKTCVHTLLCTITEIKERYYIFTYTHQSLIV